MHRRRPSFSIALSTIIFMLALAPALACSQEWPATTAAAATAPKSAGAASEAGTSLRVLANTALLAAGVVLLSVPLGTLLAVCLFRTDVPGRRMAIAAIVFLLFLPLYVQVGGWEAAIGKLGWLTSITKHPLLVGMQAVTFLHALAAIPWVVLIVSAGLRLVRREEEEVALLDAAAPRVVARVVLPQIAPFALAAGMLAGIAAAGEMTVTNIYLVDPGDYTLSEQVYMTLQAEPLAVAVRQSAPSIAATILLVAGGWWSVSRLATVPTRTFADRQRSIIYPLGNWKWPATLFVWLPLAAAVGLPLVSLAYKAGTLVVWNADAPTRTWSAVKSATMPWTALWSVRSDVQWTALFAAAAATLAMAVAIGVVYFPRSDFWRTSLAVFLAATAFALPGPVVGLAIIGLMNHDIPVFGWLYERTDLPAILAQSIRALPIVMLLVLDSLAHFPRSTLEAAKLDGAGTWSILLRIVIPQRASALAAAWLAGFAIAAGDLAWSILVLRPGVDTLQRRLFGDIHAGADDRVAAICLAISLLYAAGAACILARRSER
jgi:iron(III) transport system permease protein